MTLKKTDTPIFDGIETERDDNFIAYNDGTVLDTRTNLMWAAKDNGSNIEWVDAKTYCENYRGGGYTDWRMPTLNELGGLYDQFKIYKSESGCNLHLTKLIRITCRAPWASETRRGSRALHVGFSFGMWYYGLPQTSSANRALPVRSAK